MEHVNNPTEVRIAKAIVHRLLNLGYELRVWEGEDWACERTSDLKTILDSMASTDMDQIYAYRGTERSGWVLLIWGNGEDLLSDMSMTLDADLEGVAG